MKNFIKKYKFLIIIFLIYGILNIRLPYYIDFPGGIEYINNRVEIEDAYSSRGSFNLAFVSEMRGTPLTLLISLFSSEWDIISMDEIKMESETEKEALLRERISLKESYSNAIYLAYKKAHEEISIADSNLYVTYVLEEAKTSLKVGDIIKKVDGKEIKDRFDLLDIIEGHDISDKLEIEVINNDKKYIRTSKLIEYEDEKMIGILYSLVNEYKTDTKYKLNLEDNESGSSGGLMIALDIYNSLTKEDLTSGDKIVGTGTIDLDGNVGLVSGISYKLSSAVREGASLFIVPAGENYKEAIKLKKENKYDIEIYEASTFKDTVEYLKNR